MEPLAAIEALVKYATDEAKQKEVRELIQKHAHGVLWQPIVNVGFAAGKAEGEKVNAGAASELETVKGQLQTATGKITELEKGAPAHASALKEREDKIVDLEGKLKKEREDGRKAIDSALRARDLEYVKGKLLASGVDPDYAEAQRVLADARLKYEDGGKPKVMQRGSETLPLSVGEGQNPLDLLADELVKATPKKLITSNVAGGGGARGDNSGSGSVWSDIRAEEQKRNESGANGTRSIIGAFTQPGGGIIPPQPAAK